MKCSKTNLHLQLDPPIKGCISSIFANITLGHHKISCLKICPAEITSPLYTRCLDDKISLFLLGDLNKMFLDYITHFETEINRKLRLKCLCIKFNSSIPTL